MIVSRGTIIQKDRLPSEGTFQYPPYIPFFYSLQVIASENFSILFYTCLACALKYFALILLTDLGIQETHQ